MKKFFFSLSLIISIFFIGCSSEKESKVEIFQDFNSTELLLQWFENEMPESEIENITNAPGMILMEQNALKQEKQTDPAFADALRSFRIDTTIHDIYNISDAYQNRKRTKQLMDTLVEMDICNHAITIAAEFMPKEYTPEYSISAYFVPTGWVYGDAYIRGVVQKDNTYTLDSKGEPTSFFNLTKISRTYGNTLEEIITALQGVMAHEAFHVLFDNYKKQSNAYKPLSNENEQLLSLIHNEGIAHYVCYRNDMKNSFSSFHDFQSGSFDVLNESISILNADSTTAETKETLIARANIGSFWDKYGAISGMFMAYHIEKELGFDALVETVRTGDAEFVKTYNSACLRNTTLPQIGESIIQ